MPKNESLNSLFCDNCGEYVGPGKREYGEFVSCGLSECVRAERDAYREQDEVAQEAAAADGYSRYGGRGGW